MSPIMPNTGWNVPQDTKVEYLYERRDQRRSSVRPSARVSSLVSEWSAWRRHEPVLRHTGPSRPSRAVSGASCAPGGRWRACGRRRAVGRARPAGHRHRFRRGPFPTGTLPILTGSLEPDLASVARPCRPLGLRTTFVTPVRPCARPG